MFETIAQNRTFKEINKDHDLICIEDVSAIKIRKQYDTDALAGEVSSDKIPDIHIVDFIINEYVYSSDEFATKEEALRFRNEIMEWEDDDEEPQKEFEEERLKIELKPSKLVG